MPHDSIVDEMMSLIQMHGPDAISWNFCKLKRIYWHGFVVFWFLSSPQKISTVYVLFGYNSKKRMLIPGSNTVAKRAVNVEIPPTVSVFRIYDTVKSTPINNSPWGISSRLIDISYRHHLASLQIAKFTRRTQYNNFNWICNRFAESDNVLKSNG